MRLTQAIDKKPRFSLLANKSDDQIRNWEVSEQDSIQSWEMLGIVSDFPSFYLHPEFSEIYVSNVVAVLHKLGLQKND